jgi:hypothetical protein
MMDVPLIWLVVAGCGGVLSVIVCVVVINRVRPRFAHLRGDEREEMKHLPMTPLQRRAWWDLAVGLCVSLLILVIFAIVGPTEYDERTGVRLAVTGLFMTALIVHAVLLFTFRHNLSRRGFALDERDRLIHSRAPLAQSTAVLIALVIWAIALTEVYKDEGAIPLVFPSLIFGSAVIVSILAYAVGILVGYWIAPYNGQS